MTPIPPGGPPDGPGFPAADPAGLSRLIVAALTERGYTVAVAESLTGGLLAATVVGVPGASAAFRGGIVAYATDLKASLLGVPQPLLDEHGAVHADVARAMASGVRTRLNATFGLATTGVAGPDPQDGQPVGTVFLAAAGPAGAVCRRFAFTGDRDSIRHQAVLESLLIFRGLLADLSV